MAGDCFLAAPSRRIGCADVWTTFKDGSAMLDTMLYGKTRVCCWRVWFLLWRVFENEAGIVGSRYY